MNFNPLTIIFIIITFILIIFFFWILKTEKRLKRFFAGKKAKDLEDIINKLEEEIEILKKEKKEIREELKIANQKISQSIRGFDMIRFNPFPDQGSNQSFAISLLNDKKDGMIISSLYSRERMSVFAKSIKEGKSEYELTKEEKEVLHKANNNLNT